LDDWEILRNGPSRRPGNTTLDEIRDLLWLPLIHCFKSHGCCWKSPCSICPGMRSQSLHWSVATPPLGLERLHASRGDIMSTSLLEASKKGFGEKKSLHHLWNKWDRLVVVWKYPDISRQHLGTREPLRRNAPSSYWTWEGTINLLVGWLSMIIPGLSHIFSSPQTWNSRLRATQRYQGHPSPTWGVTRACQVSH
jgi:hypothetical protein